eukprot:GCRY01002513.1.p1 GENE.GCRY01002513.1~~GCRY01002513.1.p1  ORF type:complete len:802 (+),score=218.27 GCRY01002513.1:270-2675(+)
MKPASLKRSRSLNFPSFTQHKKQLSKKELFRRNFLNTFVNEDVEKEFTEFYQKKVKDSRYHFPLLVVCASMFLWASILLTNPYIRYFLDSYEDIVFGWLIFSIVLPPLSCRTTLKESIVFGLSAFSVHLAFASFFAEVFSFTPELMVVLVVIIATCVCVKMTDIQLRNEFILTRENKAMQRVITTLDALSEGKVDSMDGEVREYIMNNYASNRFQEFKKEGEVGKKPVPKRRRSMFCFSTQSPHAGLMQFSPTKILEDKEAHTQYDNLTLSPRGARHNSRGGMASKNLMKTWGANTLKQQSLRVEEEANSMLSQSTIWDFDVLRLNRLTHGRPLYYVGQFLFSVHGFCGKYNLSMQRVGAFLSGIEDGYDWKLPYHNNSHAAEVAFAFDKIIRRTPALKDNLTDLQRLSCTFAAVVHDFKHPGVNANYLILTNSELAMTYNDISILENYHVSQAFRFLLRPENNFLETLSPSEYKAVRDLVVDLVLATDMANHFQMVKEFVNEVSKPGFSPATKPENLRLVLKMALKIADLVAMLKPRDINIQWVDRINREFFRQGNLERERGLNVSPFMEFQTRNIPKTQMSFLSYVCKPLVEAWELFTNDKLYMQALNKHNEYWEQLLHDGVKDAYPPDMAPVLQDDTEASPAASPATNSNSSLPLPRGSPPPQPKNPWRTKEPTPHPHQNHSHTHPSHTHSHTPHSHSHTPIAGGGGHDLASGAEKSPSCLKTPTHTHTHPEGKKASAEKTGRVNFSHEEIITESSSPLPHSEEGRQVRKRKVSFEDQYDPSLIFGEEHSPTPLRTEY